MSYAKEKSYLLKDRAKELGYDLKLTHCQELVAKLEGFSNRHALLTSESKESISKQINEAIHKILSDNKIVNTKFSDDEIEEIKNNVNYQIKNSIYEKLLDENKISLKVFLLEDDCSQVDCVVAYDLEQVHQYVHDTYGDEEEFQFEIKEIQIEDLKKIKINLSESGKGKKISAHKALYKAIEEDSKIPFCLYCNWV